MSPELWKLTGTETHSLLAKGSITQQQVIDAYRGRIKQINPALNAIISETAHDTELSQPGDTLSGFTLTFKNTVDVKGSVNTRGLEVFKDQLALADNSCVKNVRDAGAIVLGITNCSPLGLRWFTENRLYGKTINPYDASLTPGGSSGGGAVAVATGMCAVAHGSDYSGSVRYPAWVCGVYGFRPTMNVIPSTNLDWINQKYFYKPLLNQLMATEGIMARSVNDVETVFDVMRQSGGSDPHWIPSVYGPPSDEKLRIGVCWATRNSLPESIVKPIQDAISVYHSEGHVVQEIEIPEFDRAELLHEKIMGDQFIQNKRIILPALDDAEMVQVYDKYCQFSGELDKITLMQYLGERYLLMAQIKQLFTHYDVVLTPVCFEHSFTQSEDNLSVQRTYEIFKAMKVQVATSFLGMPGITVPTSMIGGIPTGVQLLCDRFSENVLFKAARILEQNFGFNSLEHLP